MDIYTFIVDFSEVIVPSAATLIAFALGRKDSEKISKKEVLQKRLDNLYFPFYKMYCSNLTNKYSLIAKNSVVRNQFLSLFEDNVNFMDKESQKKLIPTRTAEIILTNAENGAIEFSVEEELNTFSNLFNQLCDSMLKEYSSICKKLKLPPPAITKRDDYSF